MQEYEVDVCVKEGVGSVDVPDEVFQDASPLWEDFLIGNFLTDVPHIAKVHAIVNKIWAMGDTSQPIKVFLVNATTMKFRICDAALHKRVLRRGMWNLAQVPVVLSKWPTFPEETQQEAKAISMWIYMKIYLLICFHGRD